jgi:hypothetical protein
LSVSHRESSRKTPPERRKPSRRAELGEHAVPRAFVWRRILNGQQHRAAPLASQTQPLAEAAQRQQQRRGKANRSIGRQRSNGDRGYPHGRKRDDQRRLAADAIAKVTEERGADRPGQERDAKGGQRFERGRGRVGCGKEQLGKTSTAAVA